MKTKEKITIALTSCGRFNLLKKTITSLEKYYSISKYTKIISEDSTNKKHIKKIKQENINGFLKGWKVIITGGKGNTNEEKHYNALEKLYSHIKTKYVFHLEDDWYFKKTNLDFIKLSKNILDKNKNIGIIQLRNFNKDGGFNHLKLSKNERKNELFKNEIKNIEGYDFYVFKNDELGDSCKGFSLNPGLRRTQEIKNIMFGYENYINEEKIGNRMKKENLYSINFKNGICYHIGNSIFSTKIIEKGFLIGIIEIIKGTFNYRIKTLFVNRILKPKLNYLYQKLDLFYPTRYGMDILSWIYRKNKIKPITKKLLTNIEGIKEYNIPISWFTEKKPLGISGVARLKNGDDFLEKVIESHIPFLDEIILIDNLSIDNTKNICIKLQKKYPNKIKFFEYPHKVKSQGLSTNIKSNSLYSLAYFYNWCFSKTKYKYVMKIDDDNYLIEEKWRKIRKYILNKKPKKYIVYWGLNILKRNNEIGICSKNKYLGKYGDHGIYPISKKTFYIQDGEVEKFVCNLPYKRVGLSFFHLKFLKKDFGLTNYIKSERGKKQLEIIKNSKVLNIKKITKYNINFIKNLKGIKKF